MCDVCGMGVTCRGACVEISGQFSVVVSPLPWARGSYSVFRLAQQELLSTGPSRWPIFFVSKVLLLVQLDQS